MYERNGTVVAERVLRRGFATTLVCLKPSGLLFLRCHYLRNSVIRETAGMVSCPSMTRTWIVLPKVIAIQFRVHPGPQLLLGVRSFIYSTRMLRFKESSPRYQARP
ncbi:unnamed protein product [Tuber aestivum]|uniref:Uncharacterized protein n=1 Tax=Tuber aestivum TaxID=59557 RepID=A0A292Q1B6_9PEZI|nr:unnamed protein product [Tuber aestivum]